jgi:hypothetical protein
MFLCCFFSLLAGCGQPKDKPIWEKVKLGDLSPVRSDKSRRNQLLKTTNMNIYVLHMPVKDINSLNDAWLMLSKKPLRFGDSQIFTANSFAIGFGQIEIWNKVTQVLRQAGGKKISTVSMMLPDGQTNDLEIAYLQSEKTIFHATQAVTIGPGRIVLQIKATRPPGTKGVSDIEAVPVFQPPSISAVPELAAREQSKQVYFTPLSFKLKMSPGDFILLGPEKLVTNRATLPGLFFSQTRPVPSIRLFLIVCNGIVD